MCEPVSETSVAQEAHFEVGELVVVETRVDHEEEHGRMCGRALPKKDRKCKMSRKDAIANTSAEAEAHRDRVLHSAQVGQNLRRLALLARARVLRRKLRARKKEHWRWAQVARH